MSATLTRFAREMIHINDNVFFLSLTVLFLVFVLLVVYWFYTRRKMQELQHQIPATVIKNYLDSVIQNSNALKSSLFRGGGLDVADGVPSIVPAGQLSTGGIGVSAEEIAQKNAEIASLQGQIGSKDSQIRELERQLAEGLKGDEAGEKVIQLQSENSGLKSELEAARGEIEVLKAASAAGADSSELDELKKKNSELEASLEEYSVISEDLANLRRLQQENDQLKKTIEELKGGAPAESAPEPAPEPEAAPEPEPEAAPEPAAEPEAAPEPAAEDDGEAAMAAAIAEQQAAEATPTEEAPAPSEEEAEMVPSNEGEQKSAEELLSEFEKMLG